MANFFPDVTETIDVIPATPAPPPVNVPLPDPQEEAAAMLPTDQTDTAAPAAFDPAQPFEIVQEPAAAAGFDPSQPFEILEEPEAANMTPAAELPQLSPGMADKLGVTRWRDNLDGTEVRRAEPLGGRQTAELTPDGWQVINEPLENTAAALEKGIASVGGEIGKGVVNAYLGAAQGIYNVLSAESGGNQPTTDQVLANGPQFAPRSAPEQAGEAGILKPVVQGLADEAGRLKRSAEETLTVDKEFSKSIPGMVAQGVGQLTALPLYGVPGLGPAVTTAQLYQEARDDYEQTAERDGRPVDEQQAHRAALQYVAAAAPVDVLLDKLIVGKAVKASVGKLTVGELAKSVGVLGASGAVGEAGQQAWLNTVAKEIEKYDPARPIDQGLAESFIVGGIVSGLAGGSATAVAPRSLPDNAENSTDSAQSANPPAAAPVQQEQAAATEPAAPAAPPAVTLPRGEFKTLADLPTVPEQPAAAAVKDSLTPDAASEFAPPDPATIADEDAELASLTAAELADLTGEQDAAAVTAELEQELAEPATDMEAEPVIADQPDQQQGAEFAPPAVEDFQPAEGDDSFASDEDVSFLEPEDMADDQPDENAARIEAEMRAEYEQEMQDTLAGANRDASVDGMELLDAIREAGGLPAKGNPYEANIIGELRTIREDVQGQGKGAFRGNKGMVLSSIFRKNAPRPDYVVTVLQGKGFDVQTVDDVLQLVRQRLSTGKPEYGTKWSDEFVTGLRGRIGTAEAGSINLDILRDVVAYGRTLWQQGVDFVDWSVRMVKQLGEKVTPYLRRAFEAINGGGWNQNIGGSMLVGDGDFAQGAGMPDADQAGLTARPASNETSQERDIDAAVRRAEESLHQARSARQDDKRITVRENPDSEGGRSWFVEWNAPESEQWMEQFVDQPSIFERDGGFYVGESSVKHGSFESAVESARTIIKESVKQQGGTYGADMDAQSISEEVFGSFPNDIPGVQHRQWFKTKWGSWYLEGRFLEDGEKFKLSVRDHDVSRTDMGRVDRAFQVSKTWTPQEVGDALKKALSWLRKKANPAISDGAAGIKTSPKGAADKSNVADLQPGNGNALTDGESGQSAQPVNIKRPDTRAPSSGALRAKLNRASESGAINTEILQEAIDYGRRIFRRGMDYFDFAMQMVKDLGDRITPYLRQVFRALNGGSWNSPAATRGSVAVPSPESNQQAADVAAPLNKAPTVRIELYQRAKQKLAQVIETTNQQVEQLRQEAEATRTAAKAKDNIRPRDLRTAGLDAARVRRAEILGSLAKLEAVMSVLPSDVRGRVGGARKMASLTTDKARLEYLKDRVQKVSAELETMMADIYDRRLRKLFKRARPAKDKAGKMTKGKAGADVHALFRELEAATEMSQAEVDGIVLGKEASINSGELTPEEEARAVLAANLLQMVADWKKRNASARADALEELTKVFERGYIQFQMQKFAERDARKARRANLISDTGKAGDAVERQIRVHKDLKLPGTIQKSVANLSTFEQITRYIFGDSDEARRLTDMERNADAQKTDGVNDALDGLDKLFQRLAGGGELEGQRLAWKLEQPSMTVQRLKMSEMQAAAFTMLWMQEDGRRHMLGELDPTGMPVGKWHYNQSFVDEIEAKLSPEAKAVRDYLLSMYVKGRPSIAAMYRSMNGIDMPQHANYSPMVVKPIQVNGDVELDPVTNLAISGSSITPGNLRRRGVSTSEPEIRSALQTYIAYTKQMEHWKAYAPFIQEARALFGNRDVRNSAEEKAGKEAVTALDVLLKVFAQGGNREAAASLEVVKILQATGSRATMMALVGKLGVLPLQSTQLGAALAEMPATAYLRRLSGLLTGQLGWRAALQSPYIQRRLRQQPVVVQVAMEGLRAAKPGMVKHAAKKVGDLIGGADALFTAGTYAIVYDWQLSQLRKEGLTGPDLEAAARTAAERITDRVAQPTRPGTRSALENTANNIGWKMFWSFASEPRKNLGLAAFAAARGITSPQFLRTIAYVYLFNALASTLIRSAWRDMRDDDDDEWFDEKNWNPWKILRAALVEPLSGIPVIGELSQGAFLKIFGDYVPEGNLINIPFRTIPAIKRLPETLSGQQSRTDTIKDAQAIMLAGGLVSDWWASASSLVNLAADASAVVDNLAGHNEASAVRSAGKRFAESQNRKFSGLGDDRAALFGALVTGNKDAVRQAIAKKTAGLTGAARSMAADDMRAKLAGLSPMRLAAGSAERIPAFTAWAAKNAPDELRELRAQEARYRATVAAVPVR